VKGDTDTSGNETGHSKGDAQLNEDAKVDVDGEHDSLFS